MTTIASSVSSWPFRIVEALVSGGLLNPEDGKRALAAVATTDLAITTVLSNEGLVDPAVSLRCFASISGLSSVNLNTDPAEERAFSMMPYPLARKYRSIGYRFDGQSLTLACAEPLSPEQVKEISAAIGPVGNLLLADAAQLNRAIRELESVAPQPVAPPSDPYGSGSPAQMAPQGFVVETQVPAPPPAPVDFNAPDYTTAGHQAAPSAASQWADPIPSRRPVYDLESETQLVAPGTAIPPPTIGSARVESPDRPAQVSLGQQVAAPAPEFGNRPGQINPADIDLNDLLVYAVQNGASDLHLANGSAPAIRIDGSIRRIEGLPELDNNALRHMIFNILPQSTREIFEATKELDTSHEIFGVGRFRVSVLQQRGAVGAVLRAIPHDIPAFESLGLPEVIASFADLRRGLVLVTGPTGSGKSTTLASIIDIINRKKPLHIMTVEDPIEFVHTHQQSIVNQREVGIDTSTFAECLRHVLRQDPDVILVGEMRDLETVSTALTAAETGHLVFATLHTQDAPQTIDRVIDVFPTGQQGQIRIQLASALEAVVTQQLVPSAEGTGRIPVAEVMVCTAGVKNLIRSAKTHQIYSLMQAGSAVGMQTMDHGLARAVRAGKITETVALDRCHDPAELNDHLKG